MRYSLRRAMSLDSVDGCTHNPKVGGSNPPPATNQLLSYQRLPSLRLGSLVCGACHTAVLQRGVTGGEGRVKSYFLVFPRLGTSAGVPDETHRLNEHSMLAE
jgi:hypothetical protein